MITIFSTCKPFDKVNALNQGNAIGSWKRLEPTPQIILCGNDAGVRDFCGREELKHLPDIELNGAGTPILGPMIQAVQEIAEYDLLLYVNADIILLQCMMEAIKICAAEMEQFVMIGRRWNWNKVHQLNFDGDWVDGLLMSACANGSLFVAATDYFAFTKGAYDTEIPPFAVGRLYWDAWMIMDALDREIPVVEATEFVCAIHQRHPNRPFGDEGKHNYELAGALHWKLTNVDFANRVLNREGEIYERRRADQS